MEEQNTAVEVVKEAGGEKGLKPRTGLIAIVILILLIAGVSFLKKPKEATSQVVEETERVESLEVTQIEAGSFYYKPNILRVKKGEKVKLEVKAVDMTHDFNIDELDVNSPIIKAGEAGESVIVEFVADKVGEFEYYCSVGQHRSLGQVGKLIVEE